MPRATKRKNRSKNKKNKKSKKAKKTRSNKPKTKNLSITKKARKKPSKITKTYQSPSHEELQRKYYEHKPVPHTPQHHKDFHLAGTFFLIFTCLILILGSVYVISDGKAFTYIKNIKLKDLQKLSFEKTLSQPQPPTPTQPQIKIDSKEVMIQPLPRTEPPKEGTESYYRLKIQEANYCETVSDCQKVDALCPFCNTYVNKNRAAQIKLLLLQVQNKFCPVEGWTCDSSSVKRQLLCLENKCVTKAII